MSTEYTPIPVTRATSARPRVDVSYGYTKQGDLSLVLSPAFITAHPALCVGAKILVGFDATTQSMCLTPVAAGTTAGLRTIRARSGFVGAGIIIIAARNIPQAMPKVEKREPVLKVSTNGDGIVLDLSHLGQD